MSNLVNSQIEKLIKPISITLDFDRFYKIINLATLLPNSNSNIKLSINDNNLIIKLTSNSGDSLFNITFDLINESTLLKNEISISSESLKKLLVSFTNTSRIGLGFSDYGIILEKEGVKAVLLHNYN